MENNTAEVSTNACVTTHRLDFEAAPWHDNADPWAGWVCFRVGTCNGLYGFMSPDTIDILAIVNDERGNGHFQDALEWFEYSARTHGKTLRFLEVWNTRLRAHLINKRGFQTQEDHDAVIKKFILA